MAPAMLREAKHATAAYNREHTNKLSVSQQVVFCLLLYMGVLQRNLMPNIVLRNGVDKLSGYFADCKVLGHDLTDMSCPRLTPLY